jgi:phage antirepressor YoqD-like protein
MDEFRAAFTIPQLAKLANISRHRLARMLREAGVQLHPCGRARMVFLAEIKRAMPALWESIEEYGNL